MLPSWRASSSNRGHGLDQFSQHVLFRSCPKIQGFPKIASAELRKMSTKPPPSQRCFAKSPTKPWGWDSQRHIWANVDPYLKPICVGVTSTWISRYPAFVRSCEVYVSQQSPASYRSRATWVRTCATSEWSPVSFLRCRIPSHHGVQYLHILSGTVDHDLDDLWCTHKT